MDASASFPRTVSGSRMKEGERSSPGASGHTEAAHWLLEGVYQHQEPMVALRASLEKGEVARLSAQPRITNLALCSTYCVSEGLLSVPPGAASAGRCAAAAESRRVRAARRARQSPAEPLPPASLFHQSLSLSTCEMLSLDPLGPERDSPLGSKDLEEEEGPWGGGSGLPPPGCFHGSWRHDVALDCKGSPEGAEARAWTVYYYSLLQSCLQQAGLPETQDRSQVPRTGSHRRFCVDRGLTARVREHHRLGPIVQTGKLRCRDSFPDRTGTKGHTESQWQSSG
eukprot:XP_028339702.1 uncharacterized protein LOC114484840 [Physeter catodon]